jgi:hypothetical protein
MTQPSKMVGPHTLPLIVPLYIARYNGVVTVRLIRQHPLWLHEKTWSADNRVV